MQGLSSNALHEWSRISVAQEFPQQDGWAIHGEGTGSVCTEKGNSFGYKWVLDVGVGKQTFALIIPFDSSIAGSTAPGCDEESAGVWIIFRAHDD